MQQPLPFDTEVYFGYVADNLLKNLGQKALTYADHALRKMRAMGDDEGFDLWLSIHAHLIEKASNTQKEKGATIH